MWRFRLEQQDHTLEMFTSVISGKKKVVLDGTIIYYDKKYTSSSGGGFQFPFHINRHQLMIAAIGDKFDLRVDNLSFGHQWELEKQKRHVNFDQHREQIDPYKAKNYA